MGKNQSLQQALEMKDYPTIYTIIQRQDTPLVETKILKIGCKNGDDNLVRIALLFVEAERLRFINENDYLLHTACSKGYLEVVKLLLEKGVQVDLLMENCEAASEVACDVKGYVEIAKHNDEISALMIACETGHAEVVTLLLESGAEVNLRNKKGHSALAVAIKHNLIDIVKILLENGANPNLPFKDNFSILVLASFKGRIEVVKLLLGNGALVDPEKEDDWSALMGASQSGHAELATILLEHGAQVDLQNADGRSALIIASIYGQAETARLLLENRATVDLQDKDGWSSLMMASGREHAEVVLMLLEFGANVDLQREDGCSALQLASLKNNAEIAQMLLTQGAQIDLQSCDGSSALMVAALYGNSKVVKLLLENGAAKDLHDKEKRTALMKASAKGHRKVVSILLENEAQMNLQNERGHTAVMFASQNGHVEVVQALLEKRAQANLQCHKGFSALMIASETNNVEVAKLLLEYGAQIDLKNQNEQSALTIACDFDHDEMLKLLQKKTKDVEALQKQRFSDEFLNSSLEQAGTEIFSKNGIPSIEDNNTNNTFSGLNYKRGDKFDKEKKKYKMQILQKKIKKSEGRMEEFERMVRHLQEEITKSDGKKEEFDRRAEQLQRIAEESETREHELDRRIQELLQRIEESEKRAEESDTRTHQLQREVEESDRRHEQLKEEYDVQWVVKREEINLTGPEIGRGGWAKVSIAEFRGVQVAVKEIHDLIISDRNKELFRREMNMAARLRHPNLVQFIGATIQGHMMILMEFMPTSLRKQLEKGLRLTEEIIKYLSLDVAKGLNYLHLIKPDPMIHRDISSANVLLEPSLEPKHWKAKITDYGSVNLLNKLNTQNPGSPAYSAPEAYSTSDQSPKMDIYSFGALILEMCTHKLPHPDTRPTLFQEVQNKIYLDIIEKCLSDSPFDRPRASDIIVELS